MSFPSILQDIADTVTNNVTWVTVEASQQLDAIVEFASHNCTAVVEFASRNYSTVIVPVIQSTVEKIQSFDPMTFLSDTKTFLESDFGVSGALLAGCLGCVIASRQVTNKIASVALILTGIGAVGVSAVLLFNPELIRGAVKV